MVTMFQTREFYLIWISPASPDKSPGEDNPEGEDLRVRAAGFRDRKFPMVIFHPKKRSGIVSVGILLALFQVERNLYIRLIHNFFLSLQNYRTKAK